MIGLTLKGLGKALVQSRWPAFHKGEALGPANPGRPLVVLANGPSLTASLAEPSLEPLLRGGGADLMSVNFAPLSSEIRALAPRWHVLADPHFFGGADPRVGEMWRALAGMPQPPVVVCPFGRTLPAEAQGLEVARFNMVGARGLKGVTHRLYSARLAMPRPRNVLVAALMCGIWLGYKKIIVLGADHSWTRTLSVDPSNRALNPQPHFYADSEAERRRVEQLQASVPIHAQLRSFAVAFEAYHDLQAWVLARGIEIVNATPGSFIDAFPRLPIPTPQSL